MLKQKNKSKKTKKNVRNNSKNKKILNNSNNLRNKTEKGNLVKGNADNSNITYKAINNALNKAGNDIIPIEIESTNSKYSEHATFSLNDRIKRLRKEAGLTQETLASLLGVSRPTVTQMEIGTRRPTIPDLIKLADIFNLTLDELLDVRDDKGLKDLSNHRNAKGVKRGIKSKPGNSADSLFGNLGGSFDMSPSFMLLNDENSKENTLGKTKDKTKVKKKTYKFNKEKFKELIIYILNKIASHPEFNEQTLHKILFLIDFEHYETYNKHFTGETYLRRKNGPYPRDYKLIISEMIKSQEITRIEDEHFVFPFIKYLPLRKPELEKFNGIEIKTIESVLFEISDLTFDEIKLKCDMEHGAIRTKIGQVIEYDVRALDIDNFSF